MTAREYGGEVMKDINLFSLALLIGSVVWAAFLVFFVFAA